MQSPPKWIAPYLQAGLGNRLFQIAAAAGLAESTGRPLVFWTRGNRAEHGSIEDTIKLFPSIPIVTNLETVGWEEVNGDEFTYRPFSQPIAGKEDRIVVKGYFQHHQYFPRGGAPRPTWGEAGRHILQKYYLHTRPAQEATWFLHVRLGDYLKLDHHHVKLDAYYHRCLAFVPPGSRVLVFSNEPGRLYEWTRQMEAAFPRLQFQLVVEDRDVDGLCLMSHCLGGGICANSTFSWWGAYYAWREGGAPNAKWFIPARWGNPPLPAEPAGLYPPWATRMDV